MTEVAPETDQAPSPILTRSQILSSAAVPTERVTVPQLGGAVLVRGMTAGERDDFEAEGLRLSSKGNPAGHLKNYRARLLVQCCVDEQGNRLFKPADVDALTQQSAASIEVLIDAALRLCGMRKEDQEELAKN